ncbi:helix-turn-helix domain-containing protein [Aquimarina addita]|uniref:Helix-turn-helix domain-containing protein n=1 Tax=Aquimarina addita TaxID=870485 RepID=A0ABP7XHI7_9FLAO
MNNIQDILDNIPIRHNFVSYFISLGIFIGFLLSVVILWKTPKKNNAFRIYGWLLVIQSIIATDVFLCYTGLIKYVLHFNDSTEPLVLLLAPLIYLFVYTLLKRRPITFKKHWIHFTPSFLYFLSQIQYYTKPVSVKINAYLGAFYPNAQKASVIENADYSYLFIKDSFRWLIIISFTIYSIMSIILILKNLYASNKKNAGNVSLSTYYFSRNTIIGFLITFALLFVIYLNFENDGGDHYIFIFNTIIVCILSFVLLSESRFFLTSWVADKYETSKSKNNVVSIEEIEAYIKTNEYYLINSVSLKSLAKELNTHPNYISKTINSSRHQNFNDFINQYRIEVSKKRLLDKAYKHLTIEAIGNSVGFKSKATFYNAFKKHVAISPSAFIKQQKQHS